MWHIYMMKYYSAIKRNKIVPFSEIWMDLETFIENEIQKEKTKYCILTYIYMESRRVVQINLFAKQK